MTYDLFIGDRLFSSWSMRGWLMLEKFGLPYRSHMIGLYSGTMAEDMPDADGLSGVMDILSTTRVGVQHLHITKLRLTICHTT